MNIAWIGTGIMGASMATHLANAGHTVVAYNRTYEKCLALQEFGITPVKTIAECVKDADAVFTIVGTPKDVEEVYFAENGIFDIAKDNALFIDMTTSAPPLAKKIFETAKNGYKSKTFRVLDAPVSGGDVGARNATLSIMVGGEKSVFDEATELLKLLGTTINHIGPAGSGQHCKACNQIAVAGNVLACAEAIAYAKASGLNPNTVLSAISKGVAASWQMDNNAPRMIENDTTPYFAIEHFLKDLNIVQDFIKQTDTKLPTSEVITSLYSTMVEKGLGKQGIQSIAQLYDN